MTYTLLSKREQQKIVKAFLLQQERDHFCHSINVARYAEMLKHLPTGQFRDTIENLQTASRERLLEVEAIITATRKANT